MSARGFRMSLAAVTFTIIIALTPASHRYGVLAADGDGESLAGAWIVTTTIPGDPNSPFQSLSSITRDGTFSESLQPGLNPLVSDCHGVWGRVGPRQFATTCVYLRSDAAGNAAGSTKVRAIATLDKDRNQGSARFQADFLDVAGHPVGSFTGTSQLSRILLERLD